MPTQHRGIVAQRVAVRQHARVAIDFDGVALNLDVQGRTFASGVSSEAGVVPRFGEATVSVPVTVSILRMVRHLAGMVDGEPVDTIRYSLTGKLHGTQMFGTRRFEAAGEFSVPREATGGTGAT